MGFFPTGYKTLVEVIKKFVFLFTNEGNFSRFLKLFS